MFFSWKTMMSTTQFPSHHIISEELLSVWLITIVSVWSPGKGVCSRFLHWTITYLCPSCALFFGSCQVHPTVKAPPSLMTQGIYGGHFLLVCTEVMLIILFLVYFLYSVHCAEHAISVISLSTADLWNSSISFYRCGNWNQRLNNWTRSWRARAGTQVWWVL